METFIQGVKQTIKYWWIFLLVGIVLIISGIGVFMTPLESYLFLSILFSINILFDGIGNIVFALSNRKQLKSWGWTLASGILGAILGVGLFIYPGLSLTILPLFLGFWVFYRSGTFIGSALELRRMEEKGWGWLLAIGVLASFMGFAIILNPVIGAASIIAFTGIALILLGIGSIMLSLKLKRMQLGGEEIIHQTADKLNRMYLALQEYAEKEPQDVQVFLQGLRDDIKKLHGEVQEAKNAEAMN